MISLEEKKNSYAEYLKGRLLSQRLVPREQLNRLSTEDILESYRFDCKTQEPFYTKEQQNQVILEHHTNKAIYNALCMLGHECPNEEPIEKQIEDCTKIEKKEEVVPHYVACWTCYEEEGQEVAYSITINDLTGPNDSNLVYTERIFIKDMPNTTRAVDKLTTKWVKKVKSYKGCPMIMTDGPVELEKCRCGCNDYYINFISKDDYLRMKKDGKVK